MVFLSLDLGVQAAKKTGLLPVAGPSHAKIQWEQGRRPGL